MLDEFPALGRLDFFESSLAFLAGYGVRASWWRSPCTRSTRPTGPTTPSSTTATCASPSPPTMSAPPSACPMRWAPRRRCGRRRTSRGAASPPGCRTCRCREQETPRPLLTAGEILQLPPRDALVLVSGLPPIRARKLKYFADRNFLARRLPAPVLASGRYPMRRRRGRDDWSGLRAASTPSCTRPGRRW